PLHSSRMAAASRLRPVLMTALAMVAGMIPMAMGIGEGSEQVAPLGRAAIGGIIASTATILLIVPHFFASMMSKAGLGNPSLDAEDEASKFYVKPVIVSS
ncbi:efflux RND transporter permease subunit, partial [Chryseobacterium sp.]|uniref:efflux RND transporter permease subunit n=1 Tax=Chryseobacterium sp. TaxID=1871047 RepID=UPI0011C9966F